MTTGRINQIAIHVFLTTQPFKAGLSGIRLGLQRFRTFLPKGVFHIHSLGRGEQTTCHDNRRSVLSCVPLASRLNLQAFASEHPSRTTRLDRGSIALPMARTTVNRAALRNDLHLLPSFLRSVVVQARLPCELSVMTPACAV